MTNGVSLQSSEHPLNDEHLKVVAQAIARGAR